MRALHRPSVLIIDDERGMREMLSFELELEGFDVVAVESGAAALDAVEERRFDLAVTDLKMPGMDGVEAMKALRAADPDIQVIVATAYASVDTAVASMRAGAYDFVQKPYEIAELTHILGRALEKSRLTTVVALYEASRALLGTLDRGPLVELLMQQSLALLRAEAVALVVPDAGGREAVRFLGHGAPSDDALIAVAARAHEDQRRAACAAVADDDGGLGLGAYRAAVSYPLQSRGQSLGSLVVLRRAPAFSASELERGGVLASQAALALDNARLYDEVALKVAELNDTREQLVHAEKQALTASLAGGVAHEVNNPLTVVRAALDVLVDLVGELDGRERAPAERAVVAEMRDVVGEALEGVERIAALLRGFHDLMPRDPPSESVAVDVRAVVEQSISSVRASRGRAAAFVVDADAGATAHARAAHEDLRVALEEVLGFLADGPCRAGGSVAPVSVRVDVAQARPRVIIVDPSLSLDDHARLRIFDPRVHLDTRRGHTMRLDLGLSHAYQLVRRNGGRLLVGPLDDDGGTCFQLELLPAEGCP